MSKGPRRGRGVSGGLVALALMTTGCGLARGEDAAAGPPPGGWPQPSGSHVTESMCGLLTDADYASLGHHRRKNVTGSVNDRQNSLDCQYESTDDLTLSLEPTADFAKYAFAAGLKDHRGQLADGHRRSVLVRDVVGAADESWFDYWTLGTAEARPVAHELRLRRGALIIGITLSGVRGKREKDPRSVLVALANLVLRRLPHVGAADTGTAHKIEYEVIGAGRAKSVDWEDYTDIQSDGKVDGPRLPWVHVVPMASAEGVQPDSPHLRAEAASPKTRIACLIVVDGVPVAAQRSRGFVDCRGTLPDTDDGAKGQPAFSRSRPAGRATGRPMTADQPVKPLKMLMNS